MPSSQDREIGLAPTFDLSDSESASDDSDDGVVPPPPSLPYPSPSPSPRFVQPSVVGNAFELPTDSESDSGSDVAENRPPPPPPPPRPSKVTPLGGKGPPPAASCSSNVKLLSFRHKKSLPPPPPPSLPPKKIVEHSKHDEVGGVVSQTSTDKTNRKYTYILIGAILVSVLMIGLAAGLSKRSNSSSVASSLSSEDGGTAGDDALVLGDGVALAQMTDKTILDDFDGPDIEPIAQEVDQDKAQAQTGFEFLDLYEGPKKELQHQDDTSPTIIKSPIKRPTLRPTLSPKVSPTAKPTSRPVTSAPTSNQWNALPEPDDPDEEYFNYSPKSRSSYGPDSWGSLTGDTREGEYWRQYKEWIDPDLDKNSCNSGSDRQSPIDLSFDVVNAECFEYHQIKDKSGTVTIDDEYNVRFEILPNKLRINYRWDSAPMRDVDQGADQPYNVPSADVPKGWGIHLPVVHIDIKVPSEHTMNGKQYAAEYQVFLIQNKDSQRGAPAVSVLFDLHPDDRRNQALQDVLDRFQNVWDRDYDECSERRLKGRELLTDEEATDIRRTKDVFGVRGGRELQEGVFNPWHHELIRSAWFYGYDGSLTEPPCTEFVEWRVIDSPALISKDQLAQMENLLFGHIDGRCRETSVHSNGSAARPIQPTKGRAVHKCMCRDFLGNGHRKWYGRNRCWEGDEHVFHEQDSEGNWISSPETKPDRTAAGVWNCWHNPALLSPCCGRSYDPFHECCAEGTC